MVGVVSVRLFARCPLDAVAFAVMSEAVVVDPMSMRLFARHPLDAVASKVMSEAMLSFFPPL